MLEIKMKTDDHRKLHDAALTLARSAWNKRPRTQVSSRSASSTIHSSLTFHALIFLPLHSLNLVAHVSGGTERRGTCSQRLLFDLTQLGLRPV